ncbi:PspC domain-containing protein [uncultured Alistipes sp.]|uniref:PspC domain-containing protein n=1 Tax=uncultured Alistipes sp. TaxID=538949 RepID=UPI0026271F5E|nr:PspC domain-containing protein [uncultured Alistipes sp.]
MKEVKKCSISGVAFTLDADAYEALEAYLESLKRTYGESNDGAEIVADIEARIAELILSTQDNTRIVEKPLILNIIQQMGSAEDISDATDTDLHNDTPRIPRRLYRDTENAKLGGVCAGIGKYFDIDPVWVRMALFLPLLFSCFGWIPFLHWASPMFGNLFGVFLICYFIMWFAVPAARTARQKLEMNGERITAQSIGETTTAAANNDPDAKAKPIVAEAVSIFGKVVLILLKLFAGLIVFGLIMLACALIIGLIAILIGGPETLNLDWNLSLWVPILGIIIALIPTILLIYVLMCMIASRKPGGKVVLVIFILWILTIIACATIAIKENVGERLRERNNVLKEVLHRQITIDDNTTTLEKLLEEYDDESIIREGRNSVHIEVPSQALDITVDKNEGAMQITSDGRKIFSLRAKTGEQGDSDSLTLKATAPATDNDAE